MKKPWVDKLLMEPGQKLNIAVMKACSVHQTSTAYWLDIQHPNCTHYRQLNIPHHISIGCWLIQLLQCCVVGIYKLHTFLIFFTIPKQQILHIHNAVQVDHYHCALHRKHPSGFSAEVRMFIDYGRASWSVSCLQNLESLWNVDFDKRLVNPGVNPSPHVHQVRVWPLIYYAKSWSILTSF